MKSVLITSAAAISTKLTILTHQNEFYIQVKEADGPNDDSSSHVSL